MDVLDVFFKEARLDEEEDYEKKALVFDYPGINLDGSGFSTCFC
jgi:hypothetical protein